MVILQGTRHYSKANLSRDHSPETCSRAYLSREHSSVNCSRVVMPAMSFTDTAMYAHYVFGTMDQDGSGTITFGDFIMGLSVLLKGTLQERINWIFKYV